MQYLGSLLDGPICYKGEKLGGLLEYNLSQK